MTDEQRIFMRSANEMRIGYTIASEDIDPSIRELIMGLEECWRS
jgi:hypothetical protein